MSYSLTRAAFINIFSYLYLLIASLATTPLLIHALGLTNFASYALSLGILAGTTSLDLGLSRSVVYYLAKSKDKGDVQGILATSLLAHATLGFILASIVIIWRPLELSVLIFLTFVVSHYQTYPESKGNFGLVNLRTFVIGTANTILASALARLGYGVDIILISLSAATLIVIGVFALSHPSYSYRDINRKSLKKVLSYGSKLQLGKLVNTLQSQYPKLLFAANPLALTIYSLSSSLVAKAAGAVAQISNAIFPYSIVERNNIAQKKIYRYIQLSLFIISILAIVFYSYYGLAILTWWLKDNEVVTGLHSFITTYRFYGLLLLLTPLPSMILESHNQAAKSSLYALYALVIEFLVVALLLPHYGVLSIAYGGVASLLVMVPILLYSTQKSVSSDDN